MSFISVSTAPMDVSMHPQPNVQHKLALNKHGKMNKSKGECGGRGRRSRQGKNGRKAFLPWVTDSHQEYKL